MKATEALARMYADLFVDRFEHIQDKWNEPLVDTWRFPQQNISGYAYRGCNRCFLPIVASYRKYRLPLWMTVGQMQDLGIWIKKGESGYPVSFTDLYIKDTRTGSKSKIAVQEYDNMAPEERKSRNLVKIFHTKWYRVFNIGQTTFGDSYPDTMSELHRTFGATDGHERTLDTLDRMVAEDSWLCPIRIQGDSTNMLYDRDNDTILIPGKNSFLDDRAYYGTLLRLMAKSIGSELRLDRGIWSDLKGDMAKEALVSELSASSMGALLGLGVTMDPGSEKYLKTWISSINGEPSFIYEAVKEASRATDCLGRALGLDIAKGIDINRVMEKQHADKVEKAKANREVRILRHQDTIMLGRHKRSRKSV